MPHDKTLAYIGERVAHFRKASGLTQEQLGEAIGRTAQSISDYETGATVTPMDVLLGISEALEISLASLVGKNPGFAEDAHAYDAGGSATSDRLGAAFAQIRRVVDQAEQALREDRGSKRS